MRICSRDAHRVQYAADPLAVVRTDHQYAEAVHPTFNLYSFGVIDMQIYAERGRILCAAWVPPLTPDDSLVGWLIDHLSYLDAV
ncbi:MAG TPA: hypothetical protein VFJ58_27310 [Armatimonadota bacterium]|nr:hypothetical protein [Armatimonadota bacterium]